MLIYSLDQMAAELFIVTDSVVPKNNLHKLIPDTYFEILNLVL